MLDFVLDNKNPSSFATIVDRLQWSIRKQVSSFMLDPMLSRVEDEDSLFNLALVKVNDAVSNFEYDPQLTTEHNERRFLAMVKKYIRNEMIDHQYAANVDKRKPKSALLSIDMCITTGNDDGELRKSEPISDDPSAFDVLVADEFDTFMREQFSSGEEGDVYGLLSKGFPPERIAGKLGLPVSRVRYIIYEKIQRRAAKYA